MEINMNCVIYTRVATVISTIDGNDIGKQEKECNKFAKAKGYRILNTFEDIAKSAHDSKRKGLREMIRFCGKNKVNAVITTDPERIARDPSLYIRIKGLLKHSGAEIECVRGQKPMSSNEGKFINQYLVALRCDYKKFGNLRNWEAE